MSNLRQAAQQALEALIPLANAACPNERECLTDEDHERAAEVLEALRAALAEPEQELGEALKQAIERINELEALNGDLYNALKQAQGMLKLTPNALLVINGAMNRWRRVNEAG